MSSIKLKLSSLLVWIFLLKLNAVLSSAETCSKDNVEICNGNKNNRYSADVNKPYADILNSIENALRTYVPCNNTKCSCHSSVISRDLHIFKSKGISRDAINSIRTKGTKYQIINNSLYRDKDCMFPSRCEGVEHFLMKLAPSLRNTELVVNTRDWPQIHKQSPIFGPVFSFSKTEEYHDIMYPAWAFWEGGPAIGLYPRGLGRWDKHRESVSQAGLAHPWHSKETKAFFRGSRTSSERDALVLLSRERPQLVDARYTRNQAWKSDADTLQAPPAAEVTLEEHCRYKYLFNFRGVAASFRLKHLFLCRSLVFHVGDEWQEFFYPALKPWVHYVPVGAAPSGREIERLLQFARDNDGLARAIADRGYDMVWQNLRMADAQCYWSRLLRKYTRLLDYEPALDDGMIRIKNK